MENTFQRKFELEKILKLVHLAEKLKTSLRHGITSVGKRESIADHCWRLSLLVT